MTGTVVEMPRVELETRAMTVVDEARAVEVVDQSGLDTAGVFLRDRIKPLLAEANELFDPVITAARKSHTEALAAKKKVVSPLLEAEAILKLAVGKFRDRQEEIRQAEERRQFQEEENRLLLLREKEVEAIEEAGGGPGLVEAVCNEPVSVPSPVVLPTYRMPTGISTRETWEANVTSLRELCKAIGAGQVPETYVNPNMTALNARARADRNLLNIPGVRSVRSTGVAARRS